MENRVLEFICRINNGCVIVNSMDKNSKYNIDNHNELYISDDCNFYFFSDNVHNGIINMSGIEGAIASSNLFEIIDYPSPADSYLILLWKVDEITDEVNSKTIEIEENQILFKKYVFYYTEEELSKSFNWLYEIFNEKNASISEVISELSDSTDELVYRFITRLIIKLPYLQLDFQKSELKDFDNYVTKGLNGIIKNKDDIILLNNKITKLLPRYSDDEICGFLFDELLEKDDDRI